MDFDIFISHASEDKKSFVRPLAKMLEENQVLVWYDEFSLKPGSSLRRSIDFGLSRCRFGIVVLSESFLKKRWTNWELDGLVARQNALENEMIIPIWLNITKELVLEFSPPLADKVAINANEGINEVVSKLLSVIKPEGSTLIIARDVLYKAGLNPPLVTDDWWLNVAEYSGREYLHHEYLSFDIPWESRKPKDRGDYIGKHALQMLWQEEAEEIGLSQLSDPNEVLAFISSQAGLKEACLLQPEKVALFFPQLTIRGFSGFLGNCFDKILETEPKYSGKHQCEEEIALRHPKFGNYDFVELADFYFSGAGGGIGPSTTRHDQIDCILWLLSSKSEWMPPKIRKALLQGLKEWAVWQWGKFGSGNISEFENTENTDALFDALMNVKNPEAFKLTKAIVLDIKERIAHGKNRLNLPEEVNILYQRFLQGKIIEEWISKRIQRAKRK